MERSLTSYLTFKLGDELFATNVAKVMEILEIPKITRVPRAPEYMRGVVNLRGNVLPVIDSRNKFGLPPTEDTINTCIIVMTVHMENQQITLGFLADAVKEVVEIDQASIQRPPDMGSKYKSEFIEGMVKSDEQFIMLLNIDVLFSSHEATILQDVNSATA
jgi:purine-binding chemotaxis protein CheW